MLLLGPAAPLLRIKLMLVTDLIRRKTQKGLYVFNDWRYGTKSTFT